MLECRNVTKKFFGFVALDNLSLAIERGELVGLIGPNGSGKTTLFNCITGLLQLDGGDIILDGSDISGKKTHEIILNGVTRTFQITHLFGEMSVLDNMIMGLQQHQRENIVRSLFRFPSARKKDQEARQRALELLTFLDLIGLKNEKSKNLSYGQQKLLSLGMALMPRPRIILLDEPTAYVNPTLIEKIKSYIRELNEQGLTVFLIEHNEDVLMDLCDRVYVLNAGRLIAEGSCDEVRSMPNVIDAYFGEG